VKIIGIIPARMDSSRFPGKPMAKIHGVPMIGHCYFRAKMCSELDEVYVATCDQVIADYIESIGGSAIMTLDSHERATDRTAEAMLKVEKSLGEEVDIVVMVQGDEPMVTPKMVSESIAPLRSDSNVNVVNLAAHMKTIEEFNDPNEVKVVIGNDNNAIYFSREPIPSRKKFSGNVPMLKQVCIIPFRRDYLLKFNNLEETSLERIESVDMLRIIENGESVRMIHTSEFSFSVDTEEDRKRVEELMVNDTLMTQYLD